MRSRPWVVAVVLGVSAALNVGLGLLLWANVAVMDEMSADMERLTAAVGPLLARHDAASRSADELQVRLRDCQVKHITDLLRAER